ncbi:MAG: hypothetical protein LBL17_01305 [Coxiellaceae bacterium]|jgi:hypothetical protein|nr:hypothetical protein [Coxiellaceae bacterium]
MKKNIKFKISLALLSCILLETKALGDIESAIKHTEITVINAISKSSLDTTNQLIATSKQMTNLFDNTFKGRVENGQIVAPSTIDDIIRKYTLNYYSFFTTKNFAAFDFTKKNQDNENAIQNLLVKELDYVLQKNTLVQINDAKFLLAEKIEDDINNIDQSYLGLGNKKPPFDKKFSDWSSPYPTYGFLNKDGSIANKIPTVSDLIGKDRFSDEDKDDNGKKAKLFVNYLLQAAPSPKNIYLPTEGEFDKDKVTIYLPYADSRNNTPYTAVYISKTIYRDLVLPYLRQNDLYQQYKMDMRSTNILRTIYLETILRPYQERLAIYPKDKQESSDPKNKESLTEKESALASEGTTKEYYDNLKNKSVADVNLEILRAINKLTYFVYKLHKDNERNSLLMGISALQLTNQQAIQNEIRFLKPIGKLIENSCWTPTDENKEICQNPSGL